MALIPILDAAGNIIRDSGGIPIYVYYDGPGNSSGRVVDIPEESRDAEVDEE